jgi:hypothetical protein
MRIRWKHVVYFFTKHLTDHSIDKLGDDQFIKGPRDATGKRPTVRISKECSDTASAEVTRPYLKQIKNVLHVTPEQILAAYPPR